MPNWCSCELRVDGPEAEVGRFTAAARGAGPKYEPEEPGEPSEFCFHSLHPVPDEVVAKGYEPAGYEWEVANWGVKWGAHKPAVVGRSEGGVSYHFQTAWGPPTEFLDKVAADWPALAFTLEFEESSTTRGTACWQNGVLASHHEEEVEYEDEAKDQGEGVLARTAQG